MIRLSAGAPLVEVERNGETVKLTASLFIVSCGAVNSAALLLRSSNAKHPRGLANSSGLVGARYMAHLATMMQGFHPFRVNDTVFQKTVAINDFYFKGSHTPVPLGDYFAGPSHVLPTGGTAKFFGPLSVNDFLKASSLIEYDAAAMAEDSSGVQDFATREGLTAHAAAARIRSR